MKRALVVTACLFIMAALAGCAGPFTEDYWKDYSTPKDVYQPKLPLGIKTLEDARKDLAGMLENRKDAVEIDFYGKYLQGLTTTPAGFDEIEKGVSGACTMSFVPPPYPGVMVQGLKNINVGPDMLKVSSRLFVSYADLPYLPITSYTQSGSYGVYLGVALSSFLGKVQLFPLSKKEAHRVADDLFFIQQQYQRHYQEQLALFEARAATYRKLAVKPPISEEQRKYIVQANSLTQQKDYDGAIDMYRKAVDLDPVSYPDAYLNLALLNGQLYRFRPAIGYMKQYLSLVPEAKDARSAQDKIYEWEGLMGK